MPEAKAGAPRRRTQGERRAATKHLVLEATIDCLVEDGYFRLSTGRVADRAGVSRGAQLHQYPTRQALVVAAIEHLAALRAAELRAAAAQFPSGVDRTAAVLDLLLSQFSGRLFQAGVELLAAARTDTALREALIPFERDLRRLNRSLLNELFGSELAEHPDYREVIGLVLNAVHGAALLRTVQPDAAFDRQRAVLERMIRALLVEPLSAAAAAGGSGPRS
ncbi:TetR family transcriptional regulator [Virgisporangium aliadipatigenens]|uniref:TetR family transcriptional regulator n=1 Tax=Virgisporangium aliadipatigenens TaxID=741659 RepID=A0A8J3YR54_9ACTN|nr:TetR/AcrR family transcriptional regulator [Virgisporangium aliadipatigenens]GIJ48465.1 TetR family transcriptional regulator [Virgisporangium aliadipatigenens]